MSAGSRATHGSRLSHGFGMDLANLTWNVNNVHYQKKKDSDSDACPSLPRSVAPDAPFLHPLGGIPAILSPWGCPRRRCRCGRLLVETAAPGPLPALPLARTCPGPARGAASPPGDWQVPGPVAGEGSAPPADRRGRGWDGSAVPSLAAAPGAAELRGRSLPGRRRCAPGCGRLCCCCSCSSCWGPWPGGRQVSPSPGPESVSPGAGGPRGAVPGRGAGGCGGAGYAVLSWAAAFSQRRFSCHGSREAFWQPKGALP